MPKAPQAAVESVRERIERIERETLAPWAARSSESRGRARPQAPHPLRTAFMRDRDRIIHSKAFRRLKHKTQVFIAPRGDHYRTRLTHTLEVAQIARTISRALSLNEDLTEAIALAHDVGHPPFGHAGEEALDELLPGGFAHDLQSLRVLTELEGGSGLNLSWEVLNGVAQHSKGSSPSVVVGKRGGEAQTLEGKVVRIADSLAYTHADVDDAVRAGQLELDALPAGPVAVLGRTGRERLDSAVLDLVETSAGKPLVEFSPAVLQAVDELRAFMFEHVYLSPRQQTEHRKAKHVVKELFQYYLEHPEQALGGRALPSLEGELIQLVCDYVAGMTDHYVMERYAEALLPRTA